MKFNFDRIFFLHKTNEEKNSWKNNLQSKQKNHSNLEQFDLL